MTKDEWRFDGYDSRVREAIEKLAALEHEQWAHWTRYMLDHLTPENIERWRRQIDTPYANLSEKEKDSDREWAERVADIAISENVF